MVASRPCDDSKRSQSDRYGYGWHYRTAWLGWADSNRGIRQDQNPPARPPDFSRNSPKLRNRDCSRVSCGVANMQLGLGRQPRCKLWRTITTGLFNMPGWRDSNSGMRKENNPVEPTS